MQHFEPPFKAVASDAILSPLEIARNAEALGASKADSPMSTVLALSVLGGVYMALGGAFYTACLAGGDLSLGTDRVVGGLAFSLAMVLVTVAGAEVFTGNFLMLIAAMNGRIGWAALTRNWGLVLVGNVAGSLAVVAGMAATGLLDGPQGNAAAQVANAKLSLPPAAVFARAVFCGVLVCLAVWMSFSARSTVGKIMAVLGPITAFVTLGFENSVANLYLLPAGLVAGGDGSGMLVLSNFLVSALGNLAGAGAIALTYRYAFLGRDQTAADPKSMRVPTGQPAGA